MEKFCLIITSIGAFLSICKYLTDLSKDESFLNAILIVGKSKLLRYITYGLAALLLLTGLLLAFNIGTMTYLKENNLFLSYAIFTGISLYFVATSYFTFKLTDLAK